MHAGAIYSDLQFYKNKSAAAVREANELRHERDALVVLQRQAYNDASRAYNTIESQRSQVKAAEEIPDLKMAAKDNSTRAATATSRLKAAKAEAFVAATRTKEFKAMAESKSLEVRLLAGRLESARARADAATARAPSRPCSRRRPQVKSCTQ